MANLIEMQKAKRASQAFGALMNDYSSSSEEKEGKESPEQELICELLEAAMQAKIFHWQTSSYAEHQALGAFYDGVSDLTDTLVEAYQGKFGRVMSGHELEVKPYTMDAPLAFLGEFCMFLRAEARMAVMGDSALNNIIDEMIALTEKTKYLLTFK
jgi:hypothetical protein